MSKRKKDQALSKKYPPSEPCSCSICIGFCHHHPGWWTVAQATKAIDAGYAQRMMLEIVPVWDIGILSPAFKGNEGQIVNMLHARNGCNFLRNNLCELHGTVHMPLECRFAHHQRLEMGLQCHVDIGKDWNTPAGKALVKKWMTMMKLDGKLPFV